MNTLSSLKINDYPSKFVKISSPDNVFEKNELSLMFQSLGRKRNMEWCERFCLCVTLNENKTGKLTFKVETYNLVLSEYEKKLENYREITLDNVHDVCKYLSLNATDFYKGSFKVMEGFGVYGLKLGDIIGDEAFREKNMVEIISLLDIYYRELKALVLQKQYGKK